VLPSSASFCEDARVSALLTVDLGNSRLKACLWRDDAAPAARFEGQGDESEDFARWLAAHPAERAGLASVAGSERTARVLAQLARAVREVVAAPPAAIEILCRSPERVGQDRLHAAAGAARLLGRSALVVNAGTALTVDVVRVSGGRCAFVGGAIAPGPTLLARALAEGTAQLPLVVPRPGVPALGTVTEAALEAGIVHGFRGAAARLVEELARAQGLGEAPVAVTGGARSFLLEPVPFSERALVVEPELVQRGLLAALREHGAGR